MKENYDYVKKEMKNNGLLIIKEIDYLTAKDICVRNHYSKKWNTSFGKINYGIFKDDRLLGVAVYGNLMNPKSAFKLVESGRVIELNRLWVDDELGHNTETTFLSATFTLLKNNTDYDLVQSFADGRLGCGTIYKASNFKYFGYEESLFYEHKITKETYHQAPFGNTARPQGFLKLNNLKYNDLLNAFIVKTYRYIYQLRKKTKINIKEETYPVYDIGYKYVDISHSIGYMVRLIMMYDNLGYDKGVELVKVKLLELFTIEEIKKEIEIQKTNANYIKFVEEYPKKNDLLKQLENIYE